MIYFQPPENVRKPVFWFFFFGGGGGEGGGGTEMEYWDKMG